MFRSKGPDLSLTLKLSPELRRVIQLMMTQDPGKKRNLVFLNYFRKIMSKAKTEISFLSSSFIELTLIISLFFHL